MLSAVRMVMAVEEGVSSVTRKIGLALHGVGPPPARGALGGILGLVVSTTLIVQVGNSADVAHTAGQFALAVAAIVLVTACFAREAMELAANTEVVEEAAADVQKLIAAVEGVTPPKPPPVKKDLVALGLRSSAELSGIMLLVYAFDRTDLIPRAEKMADTRAFWVLWSLITLVALCTVRKTKVANILAREQTEEWKGWMQLMFLLYHYFAQVQLYNAIRVYIAGYVWMTGFGNYLYYSKTRDFSMVRVAQTLFRLNFLGLIICVLLRNEYMLYYICPMHTLFTLFVYGALRVKTYLLHNPNKAAAWWHAPVAIGLTLALTSLLYDVDAVFRVAFGWWPVKPLISFHDPVHPEFTDEMHEWQFRSGLDRYVWVGGMAAAAVLPFAVEAAEWVTQQKPVVSNFASGAVAVFALALGGIWYAQVFTLDKYSYNAKHPFTSFIPLTLYIILRNLLPGMRAYYLEFFAYLGRVTLETYILQFHVWMKTTGLNGSPKFLARVLPEGWFWANFVVVSALYLYLSVRIFKLTVKLREVLVPSDTDALKRAVAATLASSVLAYGAGYLIRLAVPLESEQP